MISVSGVGSGLDIEGLVTQLVAAEGQPTALRLDRKEASLQAKLSAFGTLKGGLSSFQDSLSGLKSLSNFNARTATVSDSTFFTASATSEANAGIYDITVSKLAQSHKLASSAFTNSTDVVGSGTITFRFGTYDPGETSFTANPDASSQSVVIDSTNNTLEGIRDAINDADIGVRASVINDGIGYRLLLSSASTGADNAIEVTVSDDDGNDTDASGLSQLVFTTTTKNLFTTVSGQDAELTIDGLAITRASNTVTEAIEGVTLNLADVGSANLTIELDKAGTRTAIEEFVDSFNELMATMNQLSSFNADTQEAGTLVGDATLRTISNQIRQILGAQVGSGLVTSLADIGITTERDGTLQLDSTKLQNALDNNYDDMAAIFTAFGKPSDPLIRFVGTTDATQPGVYPINLTELQFGQAVSQGFYSGGPTAPFPITIVNSNRNLGLTVDGVASGNVRLTKQTYNTGAELAIELQSKINADANLAAAGKSVTVTFDINHFIITSTSFGSGSSVDITGGNALSTLGFSIGPGTPGQDAQAASLAGTIGGLAATADTTNGLFLTGTGDAAGLTIEVRGGSTGPRGTIEFSRGIADRLDVLLNGLLGSDSVIDARTESLNGGIDDIGDDREALDRRLEALETRLRSQFTELDVLLGELQNTSNFLAQQLPTLSNFATRSTSATGS